MAYLIAGIVNALAFCVQVNWMVQPVRAANEHMIDYYKHNPHAQWLAACMVEIGNIPFKSTRQELLKIFRPDGKKPSPIYGDRQQDCFAFRRCPLIKCDILFGGKTISDNTAFSISRPYLGYPDPKLDLGAQIKDEADRKETGWIMERLKEAKSIHPAMRLCDLNQKFAENWSGLHFTYPANTPKGCVSTDWALKSCELIQLTVTFDHQDFNEQNWKILTVSEPRLDWICSN
jgi:hypothetical protein